MTNNKEITFLDPDGNIRCYWCHKIIKGEAPVHPLTMRVEAKGKGNFTQLQKDLLKLAVESGTTKKVAITKNIFEINFPFCSEDCKTMFKNDMQKNDPKIKIARG